MLKSITTLKRDLRASLNVFLTKKKDDDEKNYLYIQTILSEFLCQIKILLLNMQILFKFPGFSVIVFNN